MTTPTITVSKAEALRYTRNYWQKVDKKEQQTIVAEHKARVQQGTDAWNAWAQAYKETLRKHDIHDGVIHFDNAVWRRVCDCAAFVFPVAVIFYQVQFKRETDFSSAQFADWAYFSATRFAGGAYFSEARFERIA